MATMMKPVIDGHWEDWVDSALGLVILSSPWFLGMFEMQMPAMNAVIVGLAVLGLSVLALGAYQDWEEWLNIALGLWLAASPWLFGYSHLAVPMAVHIGLGLLVALLAAYELWEDRKIKG